MPDLSEVIGYSDEATLPTPGIPGRLWYTIDSTPPTIYRDDGTVWTPISGNLSGLISQAGDIIVGSSPDGDPTRLGIGDPGTVLTVSSDGLEYTHTASPPKLSAAWTPPPTTGWVNVNVVGAGMMQADGMTIVVGDSTTQVTKHISCIVRPSEFDVADYFFLFAYFIPTFLPLADLGFGLVLRDSSTGKMVLTGYWANADGTIELRCEKWTSATVLDSELFSEAYKDFPTGWLNVQHQPGTTEYVQASWSTDGRGPLREINFGDITGWFTAIDQVGVFIANGTNRGPAATPATPIAARSTFTLASWDQRAE